jgi:hypothetical protein
VGKRMARINLRNEILSLLDSLALEWEEDVGLVYIPELEQHLYIGREDPTVEVYEEWGRVAEAKSSVIDSYNVIKNINFS